MAPDVGTGVVEPADLAGHGNRRVFDGGGATERALASGHPDLGEPCCQLHAARPGGGDCERHPRLLDTARVVGRAVGSEEPALERRHRLAQQLVGQVDELGEALEAIGGRQPGLAENGGVPAVAAGADPKREAAT